MDSWLVENGSRAAAVLQTVLRHLDTAYTGAVFIGKVPMVMVLCMPALRLACVPMPHPQSSGITWFVVEYSSSALHGFAIVLLATSHAQGTVWLSPGEQERRRVGGSVKCGHLLGQTLLIVCTRRKRTG